MTETGAVGREVRACLVIIGNEILSGRTQDVNLAMVAKGFAEIGVRLAEVRVIPDVAETIIETVNAVRARFDHVVTTGGIGPTHDDITAASVARAFGVELILHPEAHRLLAIHFGKRGVEMNEARLRMAHVPRGAELIDNPISVAPGFRIGNVSVLAGVPGIAAAMFESVKRSIDGGSRLVSHTIACDLPEGTFAHALGEIQERFGDVEIGSYPRWSAGGYDVNIVLRATDPDRLAAAAAEIRAMIEGLGGTANEQAA